MAALTYFGPNHVRIAKPTHAFLEHLIFHESGGYWRVGGGDSSLSITVRKGPKEYAPVPDEPSLMFFLVPKHGFFLLYFEPKRTEVAQWAPFAGGECRPWVRHGLGGDSFYAPRACFVSRPFAWQVVQEFVQSRRRSKAVPWVDRFGLMFPSPAAGDPIPLKTDLA